MSSAAPERALALTATLLLLSATPAFPAGRLVNLSAADGTPLVGMFYEAAARPSAAVLLIHMLGRSKDEWAPLAERLQSVGITALALDLRGHGRSGGNGSDLPAMVRDVEAALGWLLAHPTVRGQPVAIVGASIGANLAGIVAADAPTVRAVALISPSLEYRGLRLDTAVMKKLGERPVWFAASAEDPYAMRTVKELVSTGASREEHVSRVRGHGTALLNADQDLAGALVDWLRQRLIF